MNRNGDDPAQRVRRWTSYFYDHERKIPGRNILEYLSFAVVIAGIPLFFLEQSNRVDDDRAARTLSLVREFQDQPLLDARFRLLEPWLEYGEEIALVNRVGGLNQQEIDAWVYAIVEHSRVSGGNQLIRAIHDVTNFFDYLEICLSANLCDAEVTRTYFHGFAREFYCLYGAVIRTNREEMQITNFGLGLQTLVREWGGCQ